MVASLNDARQNVAHLWLVVDKLEQGFAARSLLADTQYVFGGWVQSNNQEIPVEQNYTRA